MAARERSEVGLVGGLAVASRRNGRVGLEMEEG